MLFFQVEQVGHTSCDVRVSGTFEIIFLRVVVEIAQSVIITGFYQEVSDTSPDFYTSSAYDTIVEFPVGHLPILFTGAFGGPVESLFLVEQIAELWSQVDYESQSVSFIFAKEQIGTILGNWLVESCGWNEYLVTVMNMLLNFVTEYLFDTFVVFRGSMDTNEAAKKKAAQK